MNDEKLMKLVDGIAKKKKADSEKETTIKAKYDAKKKVKALTDKERIDRIEELLGLK